VKPESSSRGESGSARVGGPDLVDDSLAQAQSNPSALRIGGHTMMQPNKKKKTNGSRGEADSACEREGGNFFWVLNNRPNVLYNVRVGVNRPDRLASLVRTYPVRVSST
jgi:hypothetical protein